MFDKNAATFLAKRVAGASGDARSFLELAGRAVETTMSALNEDQLDAPLTEPVVKINHAHNAAMQSKTKFKDIIMSLTAYQQQALIAAVHLSKTRVEAVSVKFVWQRCLEACGQNQEHPPYSETDFAGMLQTLFDKGLLIITNGAAKQKMKKANITRTSKLKFGQQLDDVELAIEQTLLKNPTYARIQTNLRGK